MNPQINPGWGYSFSTVSPVPSPTWSVWMLSSRHFYSISWYIMTTVVHLSEESICGSEMSGEQTSRNVEVGNCQNHWCSRIDIMRHDPPHVWLTVSSYIGDISYCYIFIVRTFQPMMLPQYNYESPLQWWPRYIRSSDSHFVIVAFLPCSLFVAGYIPVWIRDKDSS